MKEETRRQVQIKISPPEEEQVDFSVLKQALAGAGESESEKGGERLGKLSKPPNAATFQTQLLKCSQIISQSSLSDSLLCEKLEKID